MHSHERSPPTSDRPPSRSAADQAKQSGTRRASGPAVAQCIGLPPGLYPTADKLEWAQSAFRHGHTEAEIVDAIEAGWSRGTSVGGQTHIPWGAGNPSGVIMSNLGEGRFRVFHAQSAESKREDEERRGLERKAAAAEGKTADTSSNWRAKSS